MRQLTSTHHYTQVVKYTLVYIIVVAMLAALIALRTYSTLVSYSSIAYMPLQLLCSEIGSHSLARYARTFNYEHSHCSRGSRIFTPASLSVAYSPRPRTHIVYPSTGRLHHGFSVIPPIILDLFHYIGSSTRTWSRGRRTLGRREWNAVTM